MLTPMWQQVSKLIIVTDMETLILFIAQPLYTFHHLLSLNTFLKLLYIQCSMVNVSNITKCYVEGITDTIWIRHKKLIVVWFKQIQSKSHISCFVKQLDCKLKTESALGDENNIGHTGEILQWFPKREVIAIFTEFGVCFAKSSLNSAKAHFYSHRILLDIIWWLYYWIQ